MFAKTVDSVMGVFTKAIDELGKIAESEGQKMSEKKAKIAEFKKQLSNHENEQARALKTIEKLRSIVG